MMRERALEKGIAEHRHWEGKDEENSGERNLLPGSEGDTERKREQ